MELQNNDETGDELLPPPPQKRKHGKYKGETQDEFFMRWAIRQKEWIAAESSKQRQSRMHHAMNAKLNVCPSSNRSGTTVFIWIKVEGEPEREQELITKQSWSYYWDQYAETQCFYHDYCNEWDLCKVLDPGAQVLIEEDEDNDGISEDYHMVVREPTPPPPYPPLPPSYRYNSTPPPLSPSPSPPPTLITFDLNVWGGNLPGQPNLTSNITQFMPFGELLRLHYDFLNDAGELPISSMVQCIPNNKAIVSWVILSHWYLVLPQTPHIS